MKSNEELLQVLMNHIKELDYIHAEDVPNIDLYMDQVTTFMDQHLERTKRYPEDKVLTKTMINNYAKNKLLPAPEKKKYSREHILILIFIYYYKNFLSIGDIKTLMAPLCEKYFNSSSGLNLSDIYEELFSLEKSQADALQADTKRIFDIASQTFCQAAPQEQELLRRFALISLLGFDVYLKKRMIETLIDDMVPTEPEAHGKKAHQKAPKEKE